MAVVQVRAGEVDDDVVREWNAMATLLNELKANNATLRTLANELKADHNALLAKLDADAGVTDTNYAATVATSAADVAAVAAVAVNTFYLGF